MELPIKRKLFNFCWSIFLKSRIIFPTIIIIFSVGYFFNIDSKASFTQEIKFQGKIVNKTDGTNLNPGSPACIITGNNNDTCDFRISLYNLSTGGTALWSETFTDVEIGQYDGILSLSIGSFCITSQGGSWTTDGDAGGQRCAVANGGVNWNSDTNYYIQVEFDSANTSGLNSFSSPETFSRTQLTSVPYAFRSESAQKLINNDGVITFNDIYTDDIPFSDTTYTTLPSGYQSVLHALYAASGSGGGLWTINGNVTYLTSAGSDLSLASTLVSAFSVDESDNLVRIGDGSSGNGKLDFFSSTGNTGRFEYTSDVLQWSGGSMRFTNNTSLNFGTSDNFQLAYDSVDTRLEISDGTNLLAALTDNGTTATMTINGILNLGNATNNEIRTSAGAATATNNLYWGDQQICLANGTGCSANSLLWEELTFNSGSNTGTFENDHDVVIGTWTGDNTPLTNTSFVMDNGTADDLFITDLAGIGDTLYVENAVVVGTGTLTLTNNRINSGSSNLHLTAAGAYYVQIEDNLDITTGTITSSASPITFNDVYTANIPLSDASNTTLPGGATSILDALNNLAAGTSGLWTAGAGITYLSSTTDDLAIGKTGLVAPFSVDVSGNTVRIGSGSVVDAVLNMYGSDGDTGSITYNTSDQWSFTGGDINLTGMFYPGANNTYDLGSTSYRWRTAYLDTSVNINGSLILTDDYLRDTDSNINIQANNDTDDYIYFNTTSNVPYIYFEQGNSNDAGFRVNGTSMEFRNEGGSWTSFDSLMGGYWTDGGTVTYLTSATDDFAIGGTSLTAAFSVDESADTVRIGDGSSGNAVLGMYASNGSTGNITYSTADSWIFNGGEMYIQDSVQRSFIIDNSTTGSTADSGYMIFRGNYYNTSDTEIDFSMLLDITSNTDYKISFLNSGKTAEVASLDETGNLQIDGNLNLGTDTRNLLLTTTATTGAVSDLYWGDDLLCDVSAANCGISFGGGGSLFTDGGTATYLTQITDDFVIGSNNLVAPFSVDVSTNTVRIGSGAVANAVLGMYASDGDTGNITYTTNDRWEFSGGSVLIADNQSLLMGTDADYFMRYDGTIDNRLEFGFGSNQFGTIDDVSGQTYGALTFSGTTVLGAGLTGTQTALYINSGAGFTGKFLDIDLNGSNIFEISSSNMTVNVPSTFTSAGNVQIANNLNFTNSTASYITSDSPLYITAGDAVNDEDLVLSANNAGYVIVDDRLQVTDKIHLGANANNFLATTVQTSTATDNLYWGDKLICNAGLANCGELWTDGGTLSYLTSTTDDFAVGGTSLTAAFSVDVSERLVQIGNGTTANGRLDFYSSNGNSARLEMTTADILELNNAGFVFNQAGDDADFRVEGDNDQYLIFANAGSGTVGIGVAVPNAWFDIKAATTSSAQLNLTSSLGVNPTSRTSGDMWWNGTNLYFYNGSTNVDILAGAGGSLFTDNGSITYLTSTTDDLAIGGTTLASPFSVDASANTIRVGTGTGSNSVLSMYASDGDTGNIVYTTSDLWEFSGGNISVYGNIYPGSDSDYDLGSSTLRWQDVYVSSGSIHIGEGVNEAILGYDTVENILSFEVDGDLIVQATGLTGIGTDAPEGKLHIKGNTDDQILIVQANSTQTSNILEVRSSAGTLLAYIEGNGNFRMANSGTVFDDLQVPGFSVRGGAAAPDPITFGGTTGTGTIYVNAFDGTNTKEDVFFSVQLPHSYKEGSDISPHIHWAPTTANTGNVKWTLTCMWQNINGTYSTSHTSSATVAASGTAWNHQLTEFTDLSGSGMTMSSILVCSLYRDPNESADTYDYDAALLGIDFHYEMDSLGSDEEYTK